jgi:Domain of unknown function (DUF6980)
MVKKALCCTLMEDFINKEEELGYSTNVNIGYSPILREYFIYNYIDREVLIQVHDRQTIFFCPWCGTKLPLSLRNVYYKLLCKKYGVRDPNVDKHKVPPEFQTDEWWRKRGL